MAEPGAPIDEKYVTFKSQEFLEYMDRLCTQDVSRMSTDRIYGDLGRLSLKDAVVIRRQDKFASPVLATYANCIAIVAAEHPDPKIKAELLSISDYFEEQAQLAAEEGFKLPDL